MKRLGLGGSRPDPARPSGTSGGEPTLIQYLVNPNLIPPEPVDYGGHRDEVDAFIASLALMRADEVAQVHRQGLAAGAAGSQRWAEVVGRIVASAGEHGLQLGRVAAQRRASNASAASPGRVGNQAVVTDYCAGVWAEVLVLRDHLPDQVIAIAFEPWLEVLWAPEWLRPE